MPNGWYLVSLRHRSGRRPRRAKMVARVVRIRAARNPRRHQQVPQVEVVLHPGDRAATGRRHRVLRRQPICLVPEGYRPRRRVRGSCPRNCPRVYEHGRLSTPLGHLPRSRVFNNLDDVGRRRLAGPTGLEPATSGVTGRRSKPTELRPRGTAHDTRRDNGSQGSGDENGGGCRFRTCDFLRVKQALYR